jgi:hypothetical protein
MPTPLARLLRALGEGRLSPETLKKMPKSIFNCTDPQGPDLDLPLRAILGDLTPEEEKKYHAHLQKCRFCRMVHDDSAKRNPRKLRALFKKVGVDVKPKK